MKRLALVLALTLALLPALAHARPGQGLSLGSRGSLTWSAPRATAGAPGGAMPFTRSITPNSTGAYGDGYAAQRPYGYGGYASSGRSAFTSGLLGGLIGAGIGGLLFGGGFWGFHGGAGFLGLLLQLVLLYFLARWVMRSFISRPAAAGGPSLFSRASFIPRAAPFGAGSPARQPVALTRADYQAFEQVLQNVQAAWSRADIPALQRVATPEMVGYFGEQLADLSSRGLRNTVRDVRLQQGDLSEAWAEGNRQYATVSMRFTMIDVTTDAANRIVDGSAEERVTVTEFWTFMRASGGGWVLSAIQQVR